MSRPESRNQSRSAVGRPNHPGRPQMIPQNPLSARVALLQVLILLGLPIALLVLAKLVLKSFFPQLGY